MSTTFVIRSTRAPTAAMLHEALPADAVVAGRLPDAGPWPVGRVVALHRVGVSTRSTAAERRDGEVVVTCPWLASRADLRTARDLTAALADALEGAVTVDGEPVGEGGVRAHCAEAWLARRFGADVADLLDDASIDVVPVEGPARTARIGPRTLARTARDPDAIAAVLRDVQWPVDPDAWRIGGPELHEAQPVRLGGLLIGPVGPGVRTLVPPVDAIGLSGDPPLAVPVDAVDALRAEREGWMRWLDDGHLLVEPLAGTAWETLRARAASVAVDPASWQPGDAPASDAHGVLLPVLRPASWAHRAASLHRRLLPADRAEEDVDALPVVTFAYDRGDSLGTLLRDDARRLEEVEARAVAHLSARALAWEEDRDAEGRLRGLVAHDEYAAEAVLAPQRLREAQARLGTQLVLIAIPTRGVIRVQDAMPHRGTRELGRLITWCHRVHADAVLDEHLPALSPWPLLAADGVIVGVARPETGVQDAVRATQPQRRSLSWVVLLVVAVLAAVAVARLVV